MNGKISGVEMENQNEASSNTLLSTLQAEQTKKYTKATEKEEANVQVSHGLSDGQEQAIDSNADGRMSPGLLVKQLKHLQMKIAM
jgi:hypothetical protein